MEEIDYIKLEEKKGVSIWVKIFFWFSLIVLIISLGIHNVNGSSVVSEKTVNDKYLINCLGSDNIISLYSKDEDNEGEFKLIYSSKCENTKSIYSSYIDRAVKLNIINGEDEENERINYIEYFDRIYEDEINIKLDTFSNEFCFTIKLNKYADISILNEKQENVKDYYKCYPKEVLSDIETSTTGSVVVPVYINDELKKEFVISKPREEFRISFQDLGLMSDSLDDKMVITIKNPSEIETKVQIVDSNIACHTKSFIISDQYKLYCNQSQKDNNYFVQLKDSNNNIYYGEYQRPPLNNKSSTDVNWYFIGALIIVVIVIVINMYNNKSKEKDKSALQQLQERSSDDDK